MSIINLMQKIKETSKALQNAITAGHDEMVEILEDELDMLEQELDDLNDADDHHDWQ